MASRRDPMAAPETGRCPASSGPRCVIESRMARRTPSSTWAVVPETTTPLMPRMVTPDLPPIRPDHERLEQLLPLRAYPLPAGAFGQPTPGSRQASSQIGVAEQAPDGLDHRF